MIYRVGTHHGVTICREDDGYICGRPDHDCARGHLVAVVTNGSEFLAARIAELLNAPTPDVPYTHGAREALAEVRRRIDANPVAMSPDAVRGMLDAAAEELGVDEDAPPGPLSAPVSASEPQTQGQVWVEALTALTGRFEVEGGGSEVYSGVTTACNRCPWTHTDTTFDPHAGPQALDLAELVQRRHRTRAGVQVKPFYAAMALIAALISGALIALLIVSVQMFEEVR